VCKAWHHELQPVLLNNSSNKGDDAAVPLVESLPTARPFGNKPS
jgi:hypothetical protein